MKLERLSPAANREHEMAIKRERLNDAQEEFRQLLEQTRTVALATIGDGGAPSISYAPYVRNEAGHYYIYVSRLSRHTSELLASPVASILLIEDESATKQLFARKRISYLCDVEEVVRDNSEYQDMLDQFADRFGGVIEVLSSLSDFVLFRLVPRSGRFVLGFGQAFDLVGDRLERLAHVGPDQIKRA